MLILFLFLLVFLNGVLCGFLLGARYVENVILENNTLVRLKKNE